MPVKNKTLPGTEKALKTNGRQRDLQRQPAGGGVTISCNSAACLKAGQLWEKVYKVPSEWNWAALHLPTGTLVTKLMSQAVECGWEQRQSRVALQTLAWVTRRPC